MASVRNLSFICLIVFGVTACSKPAREDLPSWYHEFGWMSGTNLPHLYPTQNAYDPLSDAMINHPQFVNNLKNLKMNTFRIPISWNSFSPSDGSVNLENIRAGVAQLDRLVQRLEQVCEKPVIVTSDVGKKIINRKIASVDAEEIQNRKSVWLKKYSIKASRLDHWDKKINSNNRSPAAAGPTKGPEIQPIVTPVGNPGESSFQNRCLLILDFHQYKFGPNCGGDGIPDGIITGQQGLRALNAADPNCVFKGFGHFWENTNGVQSKWIEFSTEFLRIMHAEADLFRKYPWMTFGVEPINEPFPGRFENIIELDPNSTGEPIFSMIRKLDRSLYTFKNYLEVHQPSQIVNLIQFNKDFITKLREKNILVPIAEKSLFIFEPFLTDFMEYHIKKFQLVILPTRDIQMTSRGDYSGMRDLQFSDGVPLYWLAAPHQYYGSNDPALLGSFPPSLVSFLKLDQFPNSFFGISKMTSRLSLMEKHFRSLGMETILGEWGTGSSLGGMFKANQEIEGWSFTRDTPGWQAWISINNVNARIGLKGALWWRYVIDRPELAPKEDAFYLLRGTDDQKRPLAYESQVLKCRSSAPNNLDLVPAVFGLNSNADCPKPIAPVSRTPVNRSGTSSSVLLRATHPSRSILQKAK